MGIRQRDLPADLDARILDVLQSTTKFFWWRSSAERTKFSSNLEFVTLPTNMTLNEVGQSIQFAYFINDGLVLFLIVVLHGKNVEVGVCGREGLVRF